MTLALLIVTTLYFLCSITLTLMLPYTQISPDAAFSQVRMQELTTIVSVVWVGVSMGPCNRSAVPRFHFAPLSAGPGEHDLVFDPQAFVDVGMKWASYIVALGALLGIVTGVHRSRLDLGHPQTCAPVVFLAAGVMRCQPCSLDYY